MTDESIMPWGMHKGRQLADVPADYLLFIWEKKYARGELFRYIEENLTVLQAQARRAEQRRWEARQGGCEW